MHHATRYMQSALGGPPFTKAAVPQKVLTATEASALVRASRNDAGDYFYSAALTIAEAANSLSSGFFSWATIKLYYGAFFSIRALMAYDGFSLFYVEGSPFFVTATPGERPVKQSGNTHAVVLANFNRLYKTHPLLSQTIVPSEVNSDPMNPPDWLGSV